MRRRQRNSRFTERFASLFTTLAAAVLALGVSVPTSGDQQSSEVGRGALRVAEGILVEPDAGELEPPSIADQQDGGHDNAGYEDGSDRAPVVIAPEVPVEAVPRGYESRQQELERPGVEQDQVERGGERQQDLELPDGPGIKY
jgi:hypothetical protein